MQLRTHSSGKARPKVQPHSINPTVLETLQTYRAAHPQSTHASHRISTRFPQWEFRDSGPMLGLEKVRLQPHHPASRKLPQTPEAVPGRATVCVFRLASALKAQAFLSHARAEDKKLIKELNLEVLTLKAPFRNPLWASFPNQSLVAEAKFLRSSFDGGD